MYQMSGSKKNIDKKNIFAEWGEYRRYGCLYLESNEDILYLINNLKWKKENILLLKIGVNGSFSLYADDKYKLALENTYKKYGYIPINKNYNLTYMSYNDGQFISYYKIHEILQEIQIDNSNDVTPEMLDSVSDVAREKDKKNIRFSLLEILK